MLNSLLLICQAKLHSVFQKLGGMQALNNFLHRCMTFAASLRETLSSSNAVKGKVGKTAGCLLKADGCSVGVLT